MDKKIEELIELGYTVEEVISYRIVDPDNLECGFGAYESAAWAQAIRRFESDELRRAKHKLARWNAAVKGKA